MIHNKIKRILLPLVSCLILCVTSCTSEQEPETPLAELKFAPQQDVSRASVTASLNFNDSKFAIYGNMRYKDDDPFVIFNKTIVNYTDGQWRYDNPQYWYPKHEYSFVAMNPTDPTGTSDATYSDSRLTFSYTLPDNFQSAQDLLIATHRRMHEEGAAKPVALRFRHIMSRINFEVKNEGAADNVKVTKIVLEGINKSGKFSIIPADLSGSQQSDDYIYSWTEISNKDNLTANIQVDIPEDEMRPLFPDDNALLIVPQPDNKGVKMRITYTLYDDNTEPTELTLTAQTPIGGWESGKLYTYTLAIEEISKDINLSVSVRDWQTPNPSDVKVPEF